MATARSLVKRSMRKAGILTAGTSMTAEEASDALAELNSMLGAWSNEGLLVFARTLESFALVANDGEYTIGPSGDFDTTRPIFITSAYVRQGATDYPLNVISEEAFAGIQDKSTIGTPLSININNAFPLGTIRLWPKPAQADTLFLLSEKQLSSIATLDTVISLPPGWEDAIVYNLAIREAGEYGQEVDPLTLKIATQGKAMIETSTNRARSYDWGHAARVPNIYNGYFT